MPEALCFTLAAPIASFGSVAGNMSRGTLDRPGHSLIAGLIGAALGLEREEPRLLALADGLRIAVRMDAPGRPLRDYHTVETVKERKGFRPATRRHALRDGDRNTIITERDYLSDVCATVAVMHVAGPFTLTEMADALRSPRFTLYLGRKSCALALPLSPAVTDATSIDEALQSYAEGQAAHRSALWPLAGPSARIAADERLYPPQAGGQRVRRRTGMDDRATWRYRLLEELVLNAQSTPTGEPSA
jgi:CRISPR system Cascade subunit CasD